MMDDDPKSAALDMRTESSISNCIYLQDRVGTILKNKRILALIVLSIVVFLCLSGGLIYLCARLLHHNDGPGCPVDNCARCNGSVCSQCRPGWHGSDCSHLCTGCWKDTCSQYSGTCLDCTPGYYTTSCDIPCPKNCDTSADGNKYCDRSTGRCLTGCRSPYWGDRCTEKCSPRCEGLSCLQTNGHCLHGCQTGWYGTVCGSRCPEHCLSSCSPLQGICEACDHGYRGPMCNITCQHCKDEDCTYNDIEEAITCTKGCKDGWTSTDCMERCSEGCRGGVCDIAGNCSCIDGFYSATCSLRCPKGCKHNICSRTGICQHCRDGFYGDRCKKQCPKSCPKCDKTDGHCSRRNSGSRLESWMREQGLFPVLIVGAFLMEFWKTI